MSNLKKIQLSKGYVILLIAFAVGAIGLKLFQYHWPTAVIGLKGERLTVLVARTPWHWHRGLGKRDALEGADAMLFVFPFVDRHGIVMRDMEFPLDIVWFSNGKVVDMAPNVAVQLVTEEELIMYLPRSEANAVLEFPAGWVDQHELRIGDSLTVVSD